MCRRRTANVLATAVLDDYPAAPCPATRTAFSKRHVMKNIASDKDLDMSCDYRCTGVERMIAIRRRFFERTGGPKKSVGQVTR